MIKSGSGLNLCPVLKPIAAALRRCISWHRSQYRGNRLLGTRLVMAPSYPAVIRLCPLGLIWPLPAKVSPASILWKEHKWCKEPRPRDKHWIFSACFTDLEQPRGILAYVLPARADFCCWLEWAQCCLLFHWTYLCFSLFSLFEDWVWYMVCA